MNFYLTIKIEKIIFIVFLTFPRRKIFHYSDAQDRYTENEFIKKGDDGSRKTQEEKLKPTTQAETQKRDRLRRSRKGNKMKKAKKENYRIVTESGKQLFNQNYTEAGANRIWEMYDGIYTDDNGNQEYIYVEKI